MGGPATHLTRRGATGLLVGGPLALGFAGRAAAAQDWGGLLTGRLGELRLGVLPSKLELVRFSVEDQDRDVLMQAVVRLTWPPGMRQRGFMARGAGPEPALAILSSAIEDHFVRVTANK